MGDSRGSRHLGASRGTWLTSREAGGHGIATELSEADTVNSWPSATKVWRVVEVGLVS